MITIRTSDHHGTTLQRAYELWGSWTALVLDVQSLVDEPRNDPLSLGCLLVTDELQASAYLGLTGFYRQAIATLRSALEAVTVAVYFRAFPGQSKFDQWADGYTEGRLSPSATRKELNNVDPYCRFSGNSTCPGLFSKGGWIGFIYDRLSGFSHGRPFYTDEHGIRVPTCNIELWGGSNGPVYEPRSLALWWRCYVDVYLACLLLVGLCDSRVLSAKKPLEDPYLGLLGRALSWHFNPPEVATQIVKYLRSLARWQEP